MVNGLTQSFKMERNDKEYKHQNVGWLYCMILLWILFVILIFQKRKPEVEKIFKSDLAKRYGVSVKVLMNWICLLSPETVKSEYVGSKVKKVNALSFYRYLGCPGDRPMDRKGRSMFSRKDICRAFNISQATLSRRIMELDEEVFIVDLPSQLFRKLRMFPPKQTQSIVEYMRSRGYDFR